MTKRERNYHKRLKSMAPLDRLYYRRFRRIQRRIRAAKTVPAAVEGVLQLIRAALTYRRVKAQHAKKAIAGILDALAKPEPKFPKGGFELVNKQIDYKPDEPLLTVGRLNGTDPNT